ncbi:MAG: DUF1289 domain-containing protein [Betaproteobacteria bacterium]|nr:DUF1289 domain-containing protein [Betaproteobacteria bacterium]MDH5222311.1 DUF1289 domain-containing protein [Betaproteobacteria bacterium]MDH5352757.1 DUF1289 domain-containing protein [Betaproteobacteria bacterium]
MKSPCTKVCVMDAENRYCLGCRRTLEEIARWSEMTDREREQVLAQLAARKEPQPCPR